MKKNNLGINIVECAKCAMYPLCQPTLLGDRKFNFAQDMLKCRKHAVNRGSFLFRQGDEFKSIYAICSGGIKLTTNSSPQTEHVTGFYYPGELVGTSAISSNFYQTNAIVLSDTQICELPIKQLETISQSIPAIMAELLKLMSNELSLHQEMLMTLSGNKSAEVKLATFLINTSQRYEQHGFSANNFKLGMTRLDIGNHLGLAKATVSRMIMHFMNKGLLKINGRYCQLLDIQQLRHVITN